MRFSWIVVGRKRERSKNGSVDSFGRVVSQAGFVGPFFGNSIFGVVNETGGEKERDLEECTLYSSSSSQHREQTAIGKKHQTISSCKVMDKGAGCSGPKGRRSARPVCGNTVFTTGRCFVRICQVYFHAQISIWPWESVVASFLGRVCDSIHTLLYYHCKPGSLYSVPAFSYDLYIAVYNYPVLRTRILCKQTHPRNPRL